MSYIKPQGSLSWLPSPSEDVVSYRVYQGTPDAPPTYESPSADVGNVVTVQLPIEGLPAVEGQVVFATGAVDRAGNISDLVASEPVLIDVTAPAPVTEVVYSANF